MNVRTVLAIITICALTMSINCASAQESGHHKGKSPFADKHKNDNHGDADHKHQSGSDGDLHGQQQANDETQNEIKEIRRLLQVISQRKHSDGHGASQHSHGKHKPSTVNSRRDMAKTRAASVDMVRVEIWKPCTKWS